MDDAIRKKYEQLGVEAYYKKHGKDYQNPHFAQIEALVKQNQDRLDYSNVLDFCCGSGEVSQVLAELGYTDTIGCDPFTSKAYYKNIKKNCLKYDFQAVIKGKLKGQFSLVICSFAMHLCPEKQLYPLVHQLLALAPILVIITPHKRPVLENLDQIELVFEDFTLTPRGKKVRLKAYSKLDF